MMEDDDILYWVLEFEGDEETMGRLKQIAADYGLTPDVYMKRIFEYGVKHPDETKELIRKRQKQEEEETSKGPDIRLIREYPVHKGESEEQARENCLKGLSGTIYSYDDIA